MNAPLLSATHTTYAPFSPTLPTLHVTMGRRRLNIHFSEIVYLQGEGNYTIVHLRSGKQVVLAKTLRLVEEQLQHRFLMRVHRSYSINIAYLSSVVYLPKLMLCLADGGTFCIARRRVREVMAHLQCHWQKPIWVN